MQKNNKRIALITTWYPPISGIAVSRMSAFVEYLSDSYDIEVFCLGERTFTEKQRPNVTIHYISTSKLFSYFKSKQTDRKFKHNIKTLSRILLNQFISNPLEKWKKQSLKKLVQTHENNSFDAIISSYSPVEAHEIAIDFCKKYNNVPWIADMRDEMSLNPYISQAVKKKLRIVEEGVNNYAKAIVSVSLPILNQFKDICPKIVNFEEVRNGFNHQIDFETNPKNEVFTIGYFGSFYGQRKPDILFKALIDVQRKFKDFKFELHIYGAHNNFNIPEEIKHYVKKKEALSYINSIKQMNMMDCNILIHPRSEQKGIYTGKLFDYISANKPILAFVDKEDVAAQLINELKCGYIAEFADIEDNIKVVIEAFNDFQHNIMRIAALNSKKYLHRKYQVDKLNNLLTKLIKEN